MTYIHNKDVVEDIMQIEILKQQNDEILKKVRTWDEIPMEVRDNICYRDKTIKIKQDLLDLKEVYHFFKQTTVDTCEIFTGTLGNDNFSIKNIKNNKELKGEKGASQLNLDIDLNDVDAFKNMKSKWLYCKLCSIEIEFRNNSKASFVPILCHYLPPCYECVKHSNSFVVNSVIADGTQPTSFVLGNPYYIIRILKPTSDDLNNPRENSIPISGLQRDMFIANYDTTNTFIDFGKFIFYTKNPDVQQDVLINLKLSFKFLTYANPEDYY